MGQEVEMSEYQLEIACRALRAQERARERARRYYERNKERRQEYARKYYEQNRERRQEYSREWYERNKEYRREYDKRYYEEGAGLARVLGLLPKVEGLDGSFGRWVTGFWEGDGTIIVPIGRFVFNQREPQVLRLIQDVLGGNLYRVREDLWSLHLYGESSARLIRTLETNIVCPARARQLEPFFLFGPRTPTKEWFTGFWDAEGSSYVGRGAIPIRITVSQKDGEVLRKVKDLWGFGHISASGKSSSSWSVVGNEALIVASWLLKTSRNEAKRNKLYGQVCAFLAIARASKDFVEVSNIQELERGLLSHV